MLVANIQVSESVAAKRLKAAGFRPKSPYPGSASKWEATCLKCGEISSRTLFAHERFPCKFCSGKVLSKKAAENLASKANFQLHESYVNTRTRTLATHIVCGRTFKVSWQALRTGGGCGYCAGKKIDAADANQRAHKAGLVPISVYPKSRSKWKLQCKSCHRILELNAHGVLKGHGCPYCGGVRVDDEDAESKMITASLQPLVKYPGATTPWLCRCLKCGENVTPRRNSILSGQNGCLFCAGRKWRSKEAEKKFKEANLMPLINYPGFDSPWKSKCLLCKKIVSPTLGTVLGGGSCRFCAGVAIDPIDAIKTMKSNGLTPLTKFPGANKPWKCVCNICKKTVKPQYGKVATGEVTGCAYCSKRRIDEKDAVVVMKKAGLIPLEKYQTVHSPWKSRCKKCNQVVRPHFATVQKGSGCKFCAPYGLDLRKPATLYLIEQPELRAAKIGIAESNSDRIDVHIRYGWKVLKVWQFKTGELAGKAENAVLEYFRDELKLPPFLRPADMPQGGFTETVSALTISIDEIERVISNSSKSGLKVES